MYDSTALVMMRWDGPLLSVGTPNMPPMGGEMRQTSQKAGDASMRIESMDASHKGRKGVRKKEKNPGLIGKGSGLQRDEDGK